MKVKQIGSMMSVSFRTVSAFSPASKNPSSAMFHICKLCWGMAGCVRSRVRLEFPAWQRVPVKRGTSGA